VKSTCKSRDVLHKLEQADRNEKLASSILGWRRSETCGCSEKSAGSMNDR
jgi:hypothetical protein